MPRREKMSPNLFPNLTILYTIMIIVVLAYAPASWCDDDQRYVACGHLFGCGNIQGIGYPFWGHSRPEYCGHPQFRLNCTKGDALQITIQPIQYRVLAMDNRTRSPMVARDDFGNNNLCPQYLYNTTLDTALFTFATNDQDVSLYYGCPEGPVTLLLPNLFNCNVNGSDRSSFFRVNNTSINFDLGICTNHIVVRVNRTAYQLLGGLPPSIALLQSALASGFGLIWDANSAACEQCVQSEGRCGYNLGSNSFACYCGDGLHNYTCNDATGNGRTGNGQKRLKLLITISTVSAVIFLCAFFCGLYRWKCKENQREWQKEKRIIDLVDTRNTPRATAGKDVQRVHPMRKEASELPMMDFSEIADATNNFSQANKLGEGGFGAVYKGILEDGQQIAVKRLTSQSGQGIEEFLNESILISKLQHKNLVRLLGCCIEGEEKLQIYEYLKNKSLDTFLFDPARKLELNWGKRFNIIQGIAKGLLYLHCDSCLKIIHRDLKASNILLDDYLNPKISDFGLARLFRVTQELANTHRVVGTFGYMSPEYALGGIFSEKSDVFSFGVLLLEIVCGRKNGSFYNHEYHLNLLGYAWQLWNEERAIDFMDEALADSCSPSDVVRCINVGLLCVEENAVDRPTMPNVVHMLCSEKDCPKPKKPAFIFHMSTDSVLPQSNNVGSVNGLTLSAPDGR